MYHGAAWFKLYLIIFPHNLGNIFVRVGEINLVEGLDTFEQVVLVSSRQCICLT